MELADAGILYSLFTKLNSMAPRLFLVQRNEKGPPVAGL
jgi:hypothetical protein